MVEFLQIGLKERTGKDLKNNNVLYTKSYAICNFPKRPSEIRKLRLVWTLLSNKNKMFCDRHRIFSDSYSRTNGEEVQNWGSRTNLQL